MWARVSTYQFPSEGIDDSPSEGIGDSVARFMEALGDPNEPGLERAELLIDRSSGKALTITVWESEEALQSSVEAANRIRGSAADAAGVSILDVSHYELVPAGAFPPQQDDDEPPRIR